MSTKVGLNYAELIGRIVASASARVTEPRIGDTARPDVLIIHDDVGPNPRPDEMDTILQTEEVEKVLVGTGLKVERLAVSADLEAMRQRLMRRRPARIFNLVESLGGHGELSALVPAVIEAMGIPLCGASADNLWRSADKFLTKRDLRRAGLPTAEWLMRPEEFDEAQHGAFDWIIKSLREHASIGLDADNILRKPTAADFRVAFERIEAGPAGKCFAEMFIPGREFNMSVLVEDGRIAVFPPAEIDFSGMPADEPHIVGYRAKWDPDSPVFDTTPRTFDFPESDAPLLDELIRLTAQTAEWFELQGHARVDFRVDADGRPWILEVNANPGIHPEAGYAAAAARAGISYPDLIRRIVAAAR
jgi:D-alanine-D-alanine ligase